MRPRRPGPARYLVAHPGAELYGSDRVMLESVAAMRGDGAEVLVTLPEEGPLVAHLEATGARVRVAPTLVLRKSLLRPRNWPVLIGSAARGFRAARRMLRDFAPDAVYVSTVTLPLWPVAAATARTPSVVHLHEGEQAASRFVKWGIYAPVAFAKAIVVNSEFSRGVLAQAFPRLAAAAHVVYNGVAGPESTSPARTELTDAVRLVYLGRLSPRKGPDLIVEALAQLDGPTPFRLDLVGSVFTGYEWYESELRARITELGLDDTVRLLGFQSDVWGAVDAADIVVIPSRLDEPFGNTAVEGVLAGRVVLVSDTSGLREATDGVSTAIRFAPDDATAIAVAVRDAVGRWSEFAPKLQAEADAAAQRFSPQRYRDEIAATMASVTRTA